MSCFLKYHEQICKRQRLVSGVKEPFLLNLMLLRDACGVPSPCG
ncbi:rCG29542 [Rattus norvegicus]|uniref:RCG29542 n=1 Tax=Rattus norvegicus TaxID=10116 RepID=A6IM15_RAT|nr:rCG29542 [Rattus norvegicus]